LQLRKDFGHSVQPWLTPIPGSLFDEECLLVSIIAFLRLPQIIPEFLGKFNYELILFLFNNQRSGCFWRAPARQKNPLTPIY
jgi:hypothetical protein